MSAISEQDGPEAQPTAVRRIVVGFDGSASAERAVEWAARQAELTGSVLEVVTTWEWPTNYGWPVPFPADWDPRSDAGRMLETSVERLRKTHPGLSVNTKIVEGHPALVLVDASEAAQLLVVGSRGHGEFAGMLLGSVSEHCVTHAHCPVLVVRDEG